MVNLSRRGTDGGTRGMDKNHLTCSIIGLEISAEAPYVAAPEMPDFAVAPCYYGASKARLLQLRRRGAIKHIAFGAVDQIEPVGLDRQRPAFARQLGDPRDMRKGLVEISRHAGADLVDIKQLAGKLRGIRLGHVDPADALGRLHHAGALGQIER